MDPEVEAQVGAARRAGADSFLLWEHEGLYGTLAAALKSGYTRMQVRRALG